MGSIFLICQIFHAGHIFHADHVLKKKNTKNTKKYINNLGWAVKNWPKRHLLSLFWQEFDKIT